MTLARARRAHRRGVDLVAYVLVPIAGTAAAGVLAWNAMSIEDPPSPPVVAFDIPQSRVLADFASRIFLTRGSPGVMDSFRPLQGASVTVTARGCDPWVDVVVELDPDPRWLMAVAATQSGKPFRPALRFRDGRASRATYRHPAVEGAFVLTLSGEIRDVRASMRAGTVRIPLAATRDAYLEGLDLSGKVPPSALRRAIVSDFFAPSIDVAFRAAWGRNRAPGSCWVTTPQLTGANPALTPLGWRGLASANLGDYGPVSGATRVHAFDGGSVLRDASDPSPRQGFAPVWSCSAGSRHRNYLADRPTCAAAVAIAKPGADRTIQFELLVAGGLLSAGLVGTVAGLRRLLIGG